MEKRDDMPLWVFLAFSSISTRKGAFRLTFFSLIFTIYCVPFSLFFDGYEWLSSIFLIEDWSWFAIMIPMTVWYGLSLRWMDNSAAWESQ